MHRQIMIDFTDVSAASPVGTSEKPGDKQCLFGTRDCLSGGYKSQIHAGNEGRHYYVSKVICHLS